VISIDGHLTSKTVYRLYYSYLQTFEYNCSDNIIWYLLLKYVNQSASLNVLLLNEFHIVVYLFKKHMWRFWSEAGNRCRPIHTYIVFFLTGTPEMSSVEIITSILSFEIVQTFISLCIPFLVYWLLDFETGKKMFGFVGKSSDNNIINKNMNAGHTNIFLIMRIFSIYFLVS